MNVYTPLVSEKSFSGADGGIYTFKVPKSANKLVIKRDLEAQFKISIVTVRTSAVPGKVRQRGRIKGVKPGYKKAIVTLKKGDKIKELEA